MNREYRLENFYHGAENLKTLVILQRYIDNPAGDVVFLLGPPKLRQDPSSAWNCSQNAFQHRFKGENADQRKS